ncbi:MAG TPA: aminotransferase class III-fold pyridoxal phosphate-dependent enzyme [Planctomycetota bacterium]|nr:aminotransferase class III-fold pyridoxal phosphate-dependent enzyme [Planctomycetota bacterium]
MSELGLGDVMGAGWRELGPALDAAKRFLDATPAERLFGGVGRIVPSVPDVHAPDKRWFQRSFGRASAPLGEDLLVGKGLFYVAENRRLYLDCTAGHYQMTWGYAHPELQALAIEAMQRGIVWDNHSNIPQAPVKQLAARLVGIANAGLAAPVLDTVLLGVCTGTVACAAAIKISLLHYATEKKGRGAPVFVVLDGNYHGSDLFAQRLRGMWPDYFANVEVAAVQPNSPDELEQAFAQHGERVAAFWAEPVMMNREAIVVQPELLHLARRLCDRVGALMAIDEIQTGFWFPEVMMFRRLGIVPDFVVLGKGMTAGFHPLSALVYKGKLDCLAQYDAISTNGNAALAATVGLGCIALIEREAASIGSVGERYHGQMAALCEEFPDLLAEVRGAGHMTALKFRARDDALGFHRAAVERGLWVRAHAYHEGHSTVLTKFALLLDDAVADYAVNAFHQLLRDRPWRNG